MEPFRASHGVTTVRRLLLTEMIDADGSIVWGECSALETADYLPETIETAKAAIRDSLAEVLFGTTFSHPGDVFPCLEAAVSGNAMAKAALEMPIWTLAEMKEGVSLSTFLGGTRTTVATGVAVGLQDSPETLMTKVCDAFDEGYLRVKMKIEPGRDLEFVAAACTASGWGSRIQVDANCAYTLDDLDHLKQLDEFGLMLIEQPMAWDNLDDLATLQREFATPICLDESLDGLASVKKMVELDAGRIVCLKPGRVGGFTEALKIHDYCLANEIPVWCGGMLESGIGRAYNVALASLPGFTLPGDLSPSSRYWKRDVVVPEWTMNDSGQVTVPTTTPGFGTAIDTEFIRSLSVSTTELGRA